VLLGQVGEGLGEVLDVQVGEGAEEGDAGRAGRIFLRSY
jgi:hypothetical protein